jgi:hypothetical protein
MRRLRSAGPSARGRGAQAFNAEVSAGLGWAGVPLD